MKDKITESKANKIRLIKEKDKQELSSKKQLYKALMTQTTQEESAKLKKAEITETRLLSLENLTKQLISDVLELQTKIKKLERV